MEENTMIAIIGVAVCIGVFGCISTCSYNHYKMQREAIENGYIEVNTPTVQSSKYWTKPELEVNKKND